MCVDDAGGSQGTENKLWHLTFVGSHRRGIAAWRNNPGRLPGVGGLWGIEEEVAVFELAVGSDSPGVVHSVAPQRPANARRSRGSMLACSENKPSGSTPTSFRKARGAARACAPQNVPTRPPRLRHRPHPPQASAQAPGGRAQVSSFCAGLRWGSCRALTASPWSQGRVRSRRTDHLGDGPGTGGGGGAAERRAGRRRNHLRDGPRTRRGH